jgi:predicted GNAT superfamily acetyltransferase
MEIRTLATLAEFREAVALQKKIWAFKDIDLLPVRLFVVASKIGGEALGAFDGERMVAFSLAIPGLKPGGKFYWHSHMLGVLAEYRNYGVGRMLKLRQRENALARGIDLIEWTFDPLELKNAYFNIQRLGAIVRRYVINQYGTTSSRLHGGLPTDRCVAEWWLLHPRVRRLVEEGKPPAPPPAAARIAVPADIEELRHSDRRRAREIQERVSNEFVRLFAEGLAVVGFERREQEGAYLLAPWDFESNE